MPKIEELSQLNELRKQGALSEAEFEAQKKKILEGDAETAERAASEETSKQGKSKYVNWEDVPLKHKFWLHMLLGLFAGPLGVIPFALFPSYMKNKKGGVDRAGKAMKALFACGFVILWVIAVFNPSSDFTLPLCDSAAVEQTLGQLVANGPQSKLVNIKLLQVTNAAEISYDAQLLERACTADLLLNTGNESVRFKVTKGKAFGTFLVQTF